MGNDGRAVVITGIGLVSPAGSRLPDFFARVRAGATCIAPMRNLPADQFKCPNLAEVNGFDAAAVFGKREAAMMDRVAQFGVAAARDAVADAGLDLADDRQRNAPVIIGSGVAGMHTTDASFLQLYGKGAARLHPMTIPRLMFSGVASHVSMDLGLLGETHVVSSACASAAHAIGRASRMIRHGEADVVISGGAEACLTFGTLRGWEALRVLSDGICRPFCGSRDGLSLGEGAAILVLESLDHARARGATAYAEVRGYGATADAADLTSPTVDGPAAAMAAALRDGGLAPEDVGYINAHGTGTFMNDLVETQAIKRVFGGRAGRVPISSSKAVLGHSLGASGAFEAVVTALSLQQGVITPTANWLRQDQDCDLDYVPNMGREASIDAALSNSFAFGGLNACLLLAKLESGIGEKPLTV